MSTQIAQSLFHTPSEVGQELFYAVLRAGHIITSPEFRIMREHYPGHELLFCLKGKGYIRFNNRTWPVTADQIGWIDCSQVHAHWPDQTSPWNIIGFGSREGI